MSTNQRARDLTLTLLSSASNWTTKLTGIIGTGESCFGARAGAVDMEELYSVSIGTRMGQRKKEETHSRSLFMRTGHNVTVSELVHESLLPLECYWNWLDIIPIGRGWDTNWRKKSLLSSRRGSRACNCLESANVQFFWGRWGGTYQVLPSRECTS